MKVSIVLLAAFGIVVATCVALPFSEREDEAQLSENALERSRRSPQPDDRKETPRGSVRTKVYEESGVGLKASVEGKGKLYESENGKSRVNVEGSWSKVLDGPQRGKPEHKGGVSWDIEW
ncbi:hypothetical protein L798_12333 [Zootermopsis nevadensis]|uniref:Attacin C-terminal domain-containing protein n=1 Tax=Zootermopsis nevadensis TaxID=136037 RepID=A0A067QUD6_ZOONE|nr:hypothetical protein L798_12333 [Zootermopsis nevadensis]